VLSLFVKLLKKIETSTIGKMRKSKPADLAIIIPTLNEENYIGRLLSSIMSQTILPAEIVIIDAQSEDGTIGVIKKFQRKLPQLKYYQIPKYTISRQRNLGVKKTTSNNILFLDADMLLLESNTLEKYLAEIKLKKPAIAAATNLPDSDLWKDKGFFMAMDLTFKTIKPICPVAQGMNMYVKRSVFEKNKGFDEQVAVGEDHEFVQRIVRNGGKFCYLKHPKMYTSVRRVKEVGRMKFAMMMTLSFVLDRSLGYKKNPIAKVYQLGKHTSYPEQSERARSSYPERSERARFP
jgi:glycosyltransferase involved in cell wall biosynthesis